MCRQLADDGLATRVVALDFDGVVWDSVDEAFEMAWRTWNEQHGVPVLSKDGMRLEFLDGNDVPINFTGYTARMQVRRTVEA